MTKNNLLFIILSILVIFFWQKIITIESESEQFNLLFISCSAFIFSVILSKKFILSRQQQQILHSVIGILTISILLISWNSIFRWYSDTHDFKGNIFRGILYGFRAPFYGRINLKVIVNNYYPAIITSLLFILYILFFDKKMNSKWRRPALFLFAFFLFFSFAWNHSFHHTLMAINCHYSTFAEGLSFFPEWATFLPSYKDQMHLLGAHNNHYPPGNLMLLKLNNDFFPYLIKSLAILAPMISLFPLIGVLKQIDIKQKAIDRYIAFYISSSALLFFPSSSLTPILLIFASFSLYFLLKAIQSKSFGNAIIGGGFFALYAFFSFTFILFAFFLGIVFLILSKYQLLQIRTLLYSLSVAITSFLIVYTILFFVFDFNILDCFNTAVQNENLQMKTSQSGGLSRYLITSTGNLLAYLGLFGPMILALISLYFTRKKKIGNRKLQAFIQSVLVCIIVLAFSNQFYLEIERIWIFLSPFMLFIVIPNSFNKKNNSFVLKLLIAANMIVSLLYLITINNCT